MEPVTTANLRSFLQRLGERCQAPATIYLLGGSALCLLGSPRVTVDVDYMLEIGSEDRARFQEALAELAAEMQLDVEDVPLDEFVPLPSGAHAPSVPGPCTCTYPVPLSCSTRTGPDKYRARGPGAETGCRAVWAAGGLYL